MLPFCTTSYLGPTVPKGVLPAEIINGTSIFVELVEPPAVVPSSNATNSINVISLAYTPTGMNVHYSTPFPLDGIPHVMWGNDTTNLINNATGTGRTYAREPPCVPGRSMTMCNQYFYDIQINNLLPFTTYYYRIPSDTSGTTQSHILSFRTGLAKGDHTPYNVSLVCDMGYTNAMGTYQQLLAELNTTEFVWYVIQIVQCTQVI